VKDSAISDMLIAFCCGLLLAALFAGCDLDTRGLDSAASQESAGQASAPPLALTLVLGVYGAPDRAPGPSVRWVAGQPECNGVAWKDGLRCIAGTFTEAMPDEIQVAVWPGAAVSQTSLAHEARHWLLFVTTGNAHPTHDGDFYAEVNRANDLLWQSGR
jgi:hypothetical protein